MYRNFLPILFVVILLTACVTKNDKQIMPDLVDTGKPVLHAIDSEELRELMQRLNHLVYERNLTAQELDTQQRKAAAQLINAATDINQAIEGILAIKTSLDLDAGEQKVFISLAQSLRESAYKLKFQAESHQFDDIPDTLGKMSSTCTSCHSLFRNFKKQE